MTAVRPQDFVPSEAEADVPQDYTFYPLFDRVLVLEDEVIKVSPGGIILPDGFERPKPGRGQVVACGPGFTNARGDWQAVPDGVVPGATVLYNRHAGVDVTINKRHFLMLNAGDLLGVVLPNPPQPAEQEAGDDVSPQAYTDGESAQPSG
jgi:co-chaperonin GroES (HSP10)